MKLKNYLKVVYTIALLLSFAPVNGQAQEFSASFGSDFYSDYMFRGFNLYDGVSIQPATSVSLDFGQAGALSAGLWGHLSAEGDRKAEGFTELDETVEYSISLGVASLAVGHVWYTYPINDDDIADTAEVYGSVSLDVPASPSLTVYHDYREFDVQYYSLGFEHTLEIPALGEGFAMTPYVDFGFATNAEKVYSDDSGLMHVTYGLAFDLPLGDVSVTPSLNYNSKVDDLTTNEFFVGFGLSYEL